MPRCLDETMLERFARGELKGDEQADTAAHLERCPRCAERMASLPVFDDVVEQMREIERWRERLGPVFKRLAGIEERLTTVYPKSFGDGSSSC